ncbi:MAG: flagellar biosynthetic protein FliO [Nitrospirae bacterium]|nr:flagellar biosynthetic protein FliO [Nitrospirota bacterium]
MNKRLAMGLIGVLAALAPMAAPAAAADAARMHHLAAVRADSGATTVDVTLAVDADAGYRLAYLDQGVQITLPGAWLMPAKQHIAVAHPNLGEVFAYQYDPQTVRVRLLTQGIAGTDLTGKVTVTRDGGTLRVAVSGLPGAADPAHSPAAPAPAPEGEPLPDGGNGPRPAVAAKGSAATQAARLAEAEQYGPPVPLKLARKNALAQFERIIKASGAEHPVTVAQAAPRRKPAQDVGEPAGAGMPALSVEMHMPPRPDTGAGAPVVKPDAAPAPVEAHAPATPAGAEAAPAPAPLRLKPLAELHGKGAPPLWQSSVRMVAGLALVLALMMGGLALIKRFKVTALTSRVPIRVLGSAAVGSRQNIVVVEVDGRRLVVGVGPGCMARLADLEPMPSKVGGGPGEGRGAVFAQPVDTAPESGRPGDGPGTPFSRALAAADDRGASEVIARTTRDLKRHLQLLRSGNA